MEMSLVINDLVVFRVVAIFADKTQNHMRCFREFATEVFETHIRASKPCDLSSEKYLEDIARTCEHTLRVNYFGELEGNFLRTVLVRAERAHIQET